MNREEKTEQLQWQVVQFIKYNNVHFTKSILNTENGTMSKWAW